MSESGAADGARGGGSSIRVAALLGVFMISLDASIVNIALPTLARDLNASLSSLQWVVDGYVAAFASLLLITARFSRAVGAVTAMRIGIAGFTAASVGCALAPSATALVLARIMQGVAASLILPSALTLVTRLATANQLGRALGAFSAVVGASTALGPGAGALILSNFSWGAIFLVNVPIGVGVLWILRQHGLPGAGYFDRTGWADGALSVIGLFALCYGLIDVGRHGWGSLRALAIVAAGIAFLGLFGFAQKQRGAKAVLDTALLRRRSLVVANVATILTFSTMMGVTFLAPLVLIELYGYGLGHAALVMSITSVMILVVAPISGRLGEHMLASVGPLGCGIEAVAIWGFSLLGTHPALISVELVAAALGVGLGFTLPTLTTWAMSSVADDRVEDASALFSTARQVGLALGVAIFGSLASTEIASQLARVAAHVPGAARLASVSLTQLERVGRASALPGPVTEAIWHGLARTYRLGSALAVIAGLTLATLRQRHLTAGPQVQPRKVAPRQIAVPEPFIESTPGSSMRATQTP